MFRTKQATATSASSAARDEAIFILYAAALEHSGGLISDECTLPISREQIERVLLWRLMNASEPEEKQHLRTAFLMLGCFMPLSEADRRALASLQIVGTATESASPSLGAEVLKLCGADLDRHAVLLRHVATRQDELAQKLTAFERRFGLKNGGQDG